MVTTAVNRLEIVNKRELSEEQQVMHKRDQRAKHHRAESANDADTQRQQTNVDQRQRPRIPHGYACRFVKTFGKRDVGHWLFREVRDRPFLPQPRHNTTVRQTHFGYGNTLL